MKQLSYKTKLLIIKLQFDNEPIVSIGDVKMKLKEFSKSDVESESIKAHEYSLLYPDMLHDEFESMKASIKLIGQQDPITTLNGEILDGRHRYKACKELGIKPVTEEYTGNDPLQFVLAKHHRLDL